MPSVLECELHCLVCLICYIVFGELHCFACLMCYICCPLSCIVNVGLSEYSKRGWLPLPGKQAMIAVTSCDVKKDLTIAAEMLSDQFKLE